MTGIDPDQLLKSLDAEIAMARFRRAGSGSNRNAVRIGGILFLVIGTAIALLVLQFMASEITNSRPLAKTQAAAGETR